MLAPISWLKDFVEIRLPIKELMWKMTEVGLTCESYKKVGDDIVLDVEVTANRPDWMSIIGIAREIAAIEKTKVKTLKLPSINGRKFQLPLLIRGNFNKLSGRYTGLTISNIKVKPSPDWIQKRLKLIGLRPINNIVDITNYAMFEMGIPVHAFDYDKFLTKSLDLQLSSGGENFTSVDKISYKLPKNALIIKDGDRVIDLCGIKGGLNTGISEGTKNIFVHLPIYSPVLIRRTSQALGLLSDASRIYERGANAGGTIESLKRVVQLIFELSGGTIASEIIDIRTKDFKPWKIDLSLLALEKVLGIKIPSKEVVNILSRLNLSPKLTKVKITCTIPTYRADIKAEEDLIEEVARIYGYNKFPKTLPDGTVSSTRIPYYFDDSFHLKVKNLLVASGFSEAMTLSLISKDLIEKCALTTQNNIKILNPISIDYEYLRTSLIPSLLAAVKLNPNEEKLRLFEINKVYLGKPGNSSEPYKLTGIAKGINFREFKGVIDTLLSRLEIDNLKILSETYIDIWHPVKSGTLVIGKDELGSFGQIHPKVCRELEIPGEIYAFETDLTTLEKHSRVAVFKTVSTFPPQIEDVTLTFPEKTMIGEVIKLIRKENSISAIELKDTYQDSYTFRLWYQHPTKTLTNNEVEKIRKSILEKIKRKFGGSLKE